MSNCPIALILCQEMVSIEEYICSVYMACVVKIGQWRYMWVNKAKYTALRKLSNSGHITRPMFWNPYLFFLWADYLDILQYLTTIYWEYLP